MSNKDNEPNNRIIVHNLSFETDENGLREYFSKYGEVVNVEIPISQKENRSRGFGFVTFSSIEGATKANEQSIVHEINERKVRTSFANKRDKERDEEFKVRKLYIGKLPKEINENELKEYFGQFGNVEDAFLSSVKFAPLLNGFPQHKGYGFVTFVNDEDANKAVKHKSHVIKGANIFVRKAIPQGNEERSHSKSGRNNNNNSRKNNNNNNNNNNNRGKTERRKEGGSSSESSSQESSTGSTTQTGTYSPSTTSSSNNTPTTEKKTVVVKRKDDNKTTIQESPNTSSNNSSETKTPSNNSSETKTESTSNTRNTSSNKSSSNNNNNSKTKSITVNQSKNSKPVISIEKSSTGNPWKTQSSSSNQPQQTRDFPGLGKKKTTTKTVTTTTVTTTITIDDKEDKEDN